MPHEQRPTLPASSLTEELFTHVKRKTAEMSEREANGTGDALPEKCAEIYNLVNVFLHRQPREGENVKRLEHARQQTRLSLDVIKEALETYRFEELSLSYNGGKDCLVLLILYLAGLHAHATGQDFSSETSTPSNTAPRIQLPRTLPSIYILSANPFPSVTSFVTTSAAEYRLSLTSYPGPMRSAFSDHLASHPHLKAIFVGTRRTDPHGASLTPFTPTDGDWPRFMRVHPVLDWNYVDVWAFLRGLGDSGVEYCDLYDQGYTSLGGRGDTLPNPKLRVEASDGGEIRYRPAHELVEDVEERLGRERK